MKEFFEIVTNRSPDAVYPSGSLPYPPPCTGQNTWNETRVKAPASESREWLPFSELKLTHDPSRGRTGWKRAKKTGTIVMSDYARVHKTRTEKLSSRDKYKIVREWHTARCGPGNVVVSPIRHLRVDWTENADFSSLSGRSDMVLYEAKDYHGIEDRIQQAVISTQQSAFSSAINAYDLLTEIGELRETVGYLYSKVEGGANLMDRFASKDERAYREGKSRRPKDLLRSSDKALRALGSRWMEYRYAIMPLLYSFRDISDMLDKRGFKYNSERSRERLDLNYEFPGSSKDEYLFSRSFGSVDIVSLFKSRYDSGSLQRLASTLGFNPVRTAWELIPMSFVVDWFLAIGDSIDARTGVDLSSQSLGCTTIRRKHTREVYHHEHWYGEFYSPASSVAPNQVPEESIRYDKTFENLVLVETEDSYSRSVWNRPIPSVTGGPLLNWKRTIDAAVLAYQPTKKLLRSL